MRDPLLRLFQRFLRDNAYDCPTRWVDDTLVVQTERGAFVITLTNIEPNTDNKCSFYWRGLSDPSKKISAIKALRVITNVGLREAKDFVDRNDPGARICTVEPTKAASVRAELETHGILFDEMWPVVNPFARQATRQGLERIERELEGLGGNPETS